MTDRDRSAWTEDRGGYRPGVLLPGLVLIGLAQPATAQLALPHSTAGQLASLNDSIVLTIDLDTLPARPVLQITVTPDAAHVDMQLEVELSNFVPFPSLPFLEFGPCETPPIVFTAGPTVGTLSTEVALFECDPRLGTWSGVDADVIVRAVDFGSSPAPATVTIGLDARTQVPFATLLDQVSGAQSLTRTSFKAANLYAADPLSTDGGGDFLWAGAEIVPNPSPPGGFSTFPIHAVLGFSFFGAFPPGATVSDVRVDLAATGVLDGGGALDLYAIAPGPFWAEGFDDAPGDEFQGTVAASSFSVNWTNRADTTSPWLTPGGDTTVEGVLASTVVSAVGPVELSAPTLTSTFQSLLDADDLDDGFLLKGPMAGLSDVGIQLASDDHPDPALHPRMTVDFVQPLPSGSGEIESGTFDFVDEGEDFRWIYDLDEDGVLLTDVGGVCEVELGFGSEFVPYEYSYTGDPGFVGVDCCTWRVSSTASGTTGTGQALFFHNLDPSVPGNLPGDFDGDGILDVCDSCRWTPNGPLLGSCMTAAGVNAGPCQSAGDCAGGETCDLSQLDDDGDFRGNACAVPEPGLGLGLGAGVLGLGGLVGRGRRGRPRGGRPPESALRAGASRLAAALVALLALVALGPLQATPAAAQVVLDGTIGSAGPGVVTTTPGPGGGLDYLIRESDGARAGNNLFHSFGQFDLSSSERAVYQGSAGIENLITRVTGGPSTIDGTIRSEIPGASLFFLNPAGVLFGENARVDLTGSFHVSTADRLLFDGGDVFETALGGAATLSVDPVDGFGFADAPAPIRIVGSQLEVRNAGISLTGGDVEILGDRSDGQPAFVNARSGRFDVASLASSGEVFLEPDGTLRVENVAARGDVRLAGNVSVSTSGIDRNPFTAALRPPLEGSGPVNVYARDLEIEDADILTLTVTDEDGGDTTIDLTGDLLIRSLPGGQQSGIVAGTGLEIEPGPGDTIDPFQPFVFFAYSTTSGFVTNCTDGPCGARYEADGHAGDVTIRARNVRLENGGRITARSDTRGDAGTVRLLVSDSIVMTGVEETGERSGLSSTADSTGNPGRILIESPDATLELSDSAAIVIQNSDQSPATGTPGEIFIDVASLSMSGDARIDSSTRGDGPGGDLTIRSRDGVSLRGRTDAEEFTGITTLSQPGSAGRAGTIRIETPRLLLEDGAAIAAQPVGTTALGDAGSLVLDVSDEIRLRNASITTESANAAGGNVTAFFGRVLALEDSAITASVTTGASPGGNVTLTSDPGSAVVLADSRIVAQADAGAGGNILIETGLLLKDPESVISASSNSGIDGVVVVRAPDGQLVDLSQDLAPPPLDAKALLDEPCAARRPSGANSLIVVQRDGLPVGAEGMMPAFLPRDLYARLGDAEAAAEVAGATEPGAPIRLAAVDGHAPAGRTDRCLN